MERAYFEDCHVGDNVITPGRTITETDLILAAAHSADWLRPDSHAECGEMIVLTIGSALLFRLGDFAFLPKSSIAVAEVDKIRFHSSTKIGDTIYFEAQVIRMVKLDKSHGLLVIQALIKNQHEKTVISSIAKVLVGRRPGIRDDNDE